MEKPPSKLTLKGFNNLTKTLSFNIYDLCYTASDEQQREYIAYIHNAYNAERLTGILTDIAHRIGATILNVARQDYDPQGASVTMLIAEEPILTQNLFERDRQVLRPDAVVGHLDKSHITVHTYPESHPSNGISSFRADIDVSTCGRISPLKALDHLIDSFESDIVMLDYRVRGFTRDVHGRKCFIDHNIQSIQDYIRQDTRDRYQMIDVNVYQENIFHTKMMVREFRLDDYLFCIDEEDLDPAEHKRLRQLVQREIHEVFYGHNLGGHQVRVLHEAGVPHGG